MPLPCEFSGCSVKYSTYGVEGNRPTRCAKHKLEGMFDLIHKRCKYDDCRVNPVYGLPNKSPTHCKKHKTDNMINVVDNKCEECETTAYYGLTKGKLTHCAKHKTDSMVNKTKKCECCNIVIASFGLPNEKATRCAKHKTDEMVDVKSSRCRYENCDILASFGFIEDGRRIRCTKHKEVGMVNVSQKPCQHEGCANLPNFGLPNTKEYTHCSKHKTDEMVDIKHKKCEYEGCPIQPVFGLPNGKPSHCVRHKSDNMVNIKDKMCEECKFTYANPKYKKYCAKCFSSLFPDEKISKNYKIRESCVLEGFLELVEQYSDIDLSEFVKDKIVKGGVSRRRPDLYIELPEHVIIIENDEHQHNDYDEDSETQRIKDLTSDFKNKKIVFIRFNCDSYTIGNKKHDSLFKVIRETGLYIIRNQNKFNERVNKLYKTFQKHYTNIPQEKMIIEKLYYDC